ncbi:hypothetical protein Hanom_Chr06g00478611 [Helianthus anomalus]
MFLYLCMCRYKFKLIYVSSNFFLEMSWVKYNMFLCLLLCTFSVDLYFDVNFIFSQK